MQKNQIAAQLYTVRDYCTNCVDFEKTLEKLQKIGYMAIQLSGLGFSDYKFIKNIADLYNMKICTTHTSYERMNDDYDAVVKEHRYYDCTNIGIGYMPTQYKRDKKGYEQFAEDVNRLGAKFRRDGLVLAYHNHRFEFEKYDEMTGLDIIFHNTDPQNLGFILDTYWIIAGGENPVQWIEKTKGRMSVVHFKDMVIRNDQQVMTEIGKGNLDWKAIIKSCDESVVEWAAVEQDICPGDPFDSLKISFDNIMGMLKNQ
ncbi:MAG: sugar phosphate isomerase/epimerase [Saccharofermentanales bacterium]